MFWAPALVVAEGGERYYVLFLMTVLALNSFTLWIVIWVQRVYQHFAAIPQFSKTTLVFTSGSEGEYLCLVTFVLIFAQDTSSTTLSQSS